MDEGKSGVCLSIFRRSGANKRISADQGNSAKWPKSISMGCENSKDASLAISALSGDDERILALWNKFLRGECASWLALLEAGETERKTPPVYWMDDFQTRLVNNMSVAYPYVAQELESRPLKVRARILCSIMKFCLVNMVTHENWGDEEGTMQELAKIGRHHCKWGVDDAAYVTVENAMMDAMRTCLGADFTPQLEAHLRGRYVRVKRAIQKAERDFTRANRQEASVLRSEAAARIQKLDKTRTMEGSEELAEGRSRSDFL